MSLSDSLRAQLPDIGDGLSAMMSELSRDTADDRIDRALVTLRGAQATVLRLKEAIHREQLQACGHGQ